MTGWREMAARALAGDDAGKVAPDAPPQAQVAFSAALARLRGMTPPRWATRWQEFLTDVAAFLEEWGEQLEALGWCDGDLFGFSDNAWPDEIGLALRIRSGRVVLIDATAAIILMSDGVSRVVHYRRPSPHPSIWLFTEKRR
jgi:hypothetical protein